jgi:hypothetical protein
MGLCLSKNQQPAVEEVAPTKVGLASLTLGKHLELRPKALFAGINPE